MDKINTCNSPDSLNHKINVSQRYFNPLLLSFYDFLVYRIISQYVWGCPTALLVNRYKHYIQKNHLEVGTGTGYLIDKCDAKSINLDLMDLSRACLKKSNHRLKRYSPTLIRHNILEKPIEDDKRYDSIGINYVMHCVEGDFTTKSNAFNNLKKLLKDNGVIFGATVMQTSQSSLVARVFTKFLNRIGIFNNDRDNFKGLKNALEDNFKYVDLYIKSSVVLFVVSDEEQDFINLEAEKTRQSGV